MKNTYKILIVSLCLLLPFTACQITKQQTSIDVETKTKNEETNHSKATDKDKEIIVIDVNPNNGDLKKAYVDKDKLVDYINQTDSHQFYYEDFKEKVDLEIDELFDEAEDFAGKTITKAENYNYTNPDDYYYKTIILNKTGKKIFNEDSYRILEIIDNNSILYESDFSIKLYNDEFNAYFILDTDKKIKKFLGFYSDADVYKNIIRLYKYFYNSNKDSEERYYRIDSEKFIAEKNWCKRELLYDLREKALLSTSSAFSSNQWIESLKSGKATWIRNPCLEGNYLVGEKKIDDEDYIADIYDLKLNEKFIDEFESFYHLGDNYYAVTKHFPDIDKESVYYQRAYNGFGWENEYVVKAIYDENNFTDYKYFVIKYVGNDIFYLFDGEKYEFYNIKTKKPVLEHVDISFKINEFKNYGNLIVGNTKYDGPQILITDQNYMITTEHFKNKNLEIITEIEAKTFDLNTYPRVILKNKQAEAKINNKILEVFEIDKENPSYQIEFSEDKSAIKYYLEKPYILYKKNDYLSLTIFFYLDKYDPKLDYSKNEAYTFDIKTGDIIKFEDLFKDLNQAKIFIAENFKKQVLETKEHARPIYINDMDKLDSGELSAYEVFFGNNVNKFDFYIADFTNNFRLQINYPEQSLSYEGLTLGVDLEELKPYFKDEVIKKLGI